MNLKQKIVKVLMSKSVGTGPSSYEKRIYRAAVSQRLRNTDVETYISLTQLMFYSAVSFVQWDTTQSHRRTQQRWRRQVLPKWQYSSY